MFQFHHAKYFGKYFKKMVKKIAVIGAGVVGLSTAMNIIDSIPFVSVTVIADKFNTETTSDGAGGLFRPNYNTTPGIPKEEMMQWCKDSLAHYTRLLSSSEASKCGVSFMTGFLFGQKPLDDFASLVSYTFQNLSSEQITKMNFNYKYGAQVTTLVAECRRYLPWLMSKFQEKGGHVLKHTLKSLEELVGHFDIVVNCTGLGSKYLLPDESVYAVKGQLMQVEAPWIKHFYYFEDDPPAYIIPSADRVALGGIRLKDDYTTHTDPEVSKGIWERCTSRIPSLKNAKVLWEWAGLRPHRIPLRIEKEEMNFPKGQLKVVHNYGHGANGVTLSWGTAVCATKLVKEFVLTDSNLESKL